MGPPDSFPGITPKEWVPFSAGYRDSIRRRFHLRAPAERVRPSLFTPSTMDFLV
jgi:hypothetical protein